MNLFDCCLDSCSSPDETYAFGPSNETLVTLKVSYADSNTIKDENTNLDCNHFEEPRMVHLITHVELFLPYEIEKQYNKNIALKTPIPIRKIPTIENLLSDSTHFSKIPKKSDPIPIDHSNTYL